jgi:hypothetical protein
MLKLTDLAGPPSKSLGAQHKGIVVDNNDPLMKCRIKVKVPGILEGSSLPWTLPLASSFLGDSEAHARVEIPEVGTQVTVIFPHDDPHMPYYVGRWAQWEVPEEFKVNYPNRYGYKDSVGNVFYVDKSTLETKYVHPSGFTVTISANGQLSIVGPQGIDIILGQSFETTAPAGSTFTTPDLKSTGEVTDKIRSMSADRLIYNDHGHPSAPPGPVSVPTKKQ